MADRLSRVARSYVNYYGNALVSATEDPNIMLDQVVEDMGSDVVKLRQSYAQLAARQRMLQQKLEAEQQGVAHWQKRAEVSVHARQDDLAREAIKRRIAAEGRAKLLQGQLKQYEVAAASMRGSVDKLQSQYEETRFRAPTMKARWKAAQANKTISDAAAGFASNSAGALSAWQRAEDKVLALEMEVESITPSLLTADAALEERFLDLEGPDFWQNRQKILPAR